MDRVESHSKLPTPLCDVKYYYSSDTFSVSLKQAFQSESEVESSKIVVMPVMTIGMNNLKAEMATMKAMLEGLIKESEEKEARIKLQEEKIARLTKKLKKRPTNPSQKT